MKKGFTLIELLAVIVILSIVSLIATPIAINVIDESKTATCTYNKGIIERSAELYVRSGKATFVDGISKRVTLQELVDNNLVEGRIRGFCDAENSYVDIVRDGSNYDYTTTMLCSVCSTSPNQNNDTPQDTYCDVNEVHLNYVFPDDAYGIKWRVSNPGEVRDDPKLEWQDYPADGICVDPTKVSNVWTKYQLDGTDVVIPPTGQLMVNINYYPNDVVTNKVTVSIDYSNDATVKAYRILYDNHNTGWFNYTEPFEVTENVTIEAKVGKTIDIYDVDGTFLGTSLITNVDSVKIKNIGKVATYESIAPTIIAHEGVLEDEVARIDIEYPFNVDPSFYKYKINYGEELTYNDTISINECGSEIIAYYYFNGSQSKIATHKVVCNNSSAPFEDTKFSVDIIMTPDPQLMPDIESSYIRINVPDSVEAVYTIEKRVKEGGLEKTYVEGPYVYKDPIYVYISGKINVTATDKITGEVVTASRSYVFKEQTKIIDPKIISTSIDDATKEVLSLVYTDIDVRRVRYKLDGGRFIDYTEPFVLDENGIVVYAEVEYNNGIVYAASYVTSKIRSFREPVISVVNYYGKEKQLIGITYDKHYSKGAKYSIDGGEFKNYTEPFIIYDNNVVIAVENISNDGVRHYVSYMTSGIEKQVKPIVGSRGVSDDTKEAFTATFDGRSLKGAYYVINDGTSVPLTLNKYNTGGMTTTKNGDKVIFYAVYDGDYVVYSDEYVTSKIRGLRGPRIEEIVVDNDKNEIYSLIKIIPDYFAVSTKYKLNDSDYIDYVNPFKVYNDGDVITAVSYDIDGISKMTVYSVKNVAYIKDPVITSESKNDSLIERITINFDERLLVSKKYSISGGALMDYTGYVDIDHNGEVIYAEARYSDGSIKTASFVTSKIRSMRNATISSYDDTKELQAHVTISYDNALAVKKQYRIDDGALLDYTGEIILTNNATVTAYSEDIDGNVKEVSKNVVITPISDIYISSNISGDQLGYIIGLSYDTRALEYVKYSIAGNELNDYTTTFELYDKDIVVYAEAKYKNGLIKSSTYVTTSGLKYVSNPSISSSYTDDNTVSNPVIYIDGRRFSDAKIYIGDYEYTCAWKDIERSTDKRCFLPTIRSNGTNITATINYSHGVTKEASYTENGIRDIKAPIITSTVDGLGENVCIYFDNYLGIKFNYTIDTKNYTTVSPSVCFKTYTNDTVISANQTSKISGLQADASYVTTKATSASDIRIISSLSADKHSESFELVYSGADLDSVTYNIDGGSEIPYTGNFTIRKNDTILSFTAKYKNGEIKTASYNVTNIIEVLTTKITISPNVSTLVEKVMVTIDYDSKATEKVYTINGGVEKVYTGPFELTKSATIKAIARAKSAYGESSRMVSNILSDELASPVFSMSKMAGVIGEKAVVTIEYDSKSIKKLYSLDGITFNTYTAPFIVDENETVVYAMSQDADNNNAQSQYVVTGLVQYAIVPLDGYSILRLSYPNGSINQEYKTSDVGIWKPYYASRGIAVIDSLYAEQAITSGVVKLRDERGNLIDYSDDYYISDNLSTFLAGISMRWDVETKQPLRIVATPDNSITTDTTYVIILPPAGTVSTEYTVNDYGYYQTYTNALRVIENNTTITARVKYKDGTYSDTVSYKVTNISREDDGISSEKIYTAIDLNAIRYNLNGHYTLMNDIDLASSDYALSFSTLGCFKGTFEGNGYKIKNLAVSDKGLFTCLEAGSVVKNLTIERMFINSTNGDKVGGLAGYINGENVTIDNVKITGSSTIRGTTNVGGLIGYSNHAVTLNNVGISSSVKVTGTSNYIGGLIGYGNNVNITNSYSKATVTGSTSGYGNVGGLAGHMTGSITNSYASGNVIGCDSVGGLVGYASNVITITESYASGNITGRNTLGGLVGYLNSGATISRSYSSGNITGNDTLGGIIAYVNGNGVNISQVYSSGDIRGTNNNGGGLIGRTYYGANITDAYALGNVTMSRYAGGLIGSGDRGSNVTNAYTIGKVTGASYVDQIYGTMPGGTHKNIYFIADTSGRYSSGYATKINTIYEGTLSNSYGGFDFANTWAVEENNTTPYLQGMMIDSKNYIVNSITIPRDGFGTIESPYMIYTAKDLYDIRNSLYAHYKLANDIDLSTSDYKATFPTINDFHGSLDGDGHTIKGLKASSNGLFTTTVGVTIKNLVLDTPGVISAGSDNTGILIGNATGTTKIENITIVGTTTISGNNNVGGLIGRADTITFDNIKIPETVTVKGSASYIGGIIGTGSSVTIKDSYSKATISGNTNSSGNVGGLAGHMVGSITNSYASGNVTGLDSIGGLVGYTSNVITITESYASGNITGRNTLGGLVGYLNSGATISRSYSSGNITGNDTLGGIIAYVNSNGVNISQVYSSGNITGTSNNGGGLIGRTYYGANITDAYALGNVTMRGYVGGLIGSGERGSNVTNAYTIGKVSGASYIDQTYGTMNGGTHRNIYFVADTSGRYSSGYATKINTIYEGTLSKSYAGYDFESIWSSDDGVTTPYLQGMMVDDKNYIVNSITVPREGQGTENDRYLIYNAEDLYNIRYSLYGHYKLMNDIDLTISPYKNSFATILDFHGSLDGDNHTIKGLVASTNGLFASTVDTTIKNLILDTPQVKGTSNDNTGLLIGNALGTTKIENITIVGNGFVKGASNVGGLIGQANIITFDNIKIPETMRVNGTINYIGGIIGYGTNVTIKNSYSKAPVTGNTSSYGNVGGLAGHMVGSITNSYASGNVTGCDSVGGLVGYASNVITITESYASGNITGRNTLGGLVGYLNSGATISRSYSSGNIKGNDTLGGIIAYVNGNGVNISQVYSSGNITGTSNNGGGLIGRTYYGANITDAYALGNVTMSGYAGGLIGGNSRPSNVTNAYTIGKVTGASYVDQIYGTMPGGTHKNIYFIAETSSRTSAGYATKIDTLEDGTKANSYAGFDFNTVWETEDGVTLPHLQGLTIDSKNYISNLNQ